MLGMVPFFKRLQGRHEVVTAGNTARDDTLRDTRCDGAFDDGGDGVHGPYDFRLELWRNVEFDLLEEVLRRAEAANDKDVLEGKLCQQTIPLKGTGVEQNKLTWRILF